MLTAVSARAPGHQVGRGADPSKGASSSETAEKVRRRFRSRVSRQQISLDVLAEAVRRAVWTSRNRVDRIAAAEIDFFSGLPQKRSISTVVEYVCPAARAGRRQRGSFHTGRVQAMTAPSCALHTL